LTLSILDGDGFAAVLPTGAQCAEGPLPEGVLRADQFCAGRRCANTALRRLGHIGAEVARGNAGEPLWPRGVVGSITHGAGRCAAVVAPRDNTLIGLGIDVARHAPLADRVARRVLPGSCWPGLDIVPGIQWGAVVFSAKEAVFKAWYPLARSFLRFADAHLEVHGDGTIEVEVARAPRGSWVGTTWHGRYLVDGGTVRTIVVVERA
jgi:4'-phosphopantetheinyl transferase EntD